ncbi:hypothetical protein [Hymenobacter psychrotolerans]|nr:hypothetical protein [Hymenobacter psychrotolerans]
MSLRYGCPTAGNTPNNLRNSGAGQLLQMLDKLESIAGGLSGIREVLKRE